MKFWFLLIYWILSTSRQLKYNLFTIAAHSWSYSWIFLFSKLWKMMYEPSWWWIHDNFAFSFRVSYEINVALTNLVVVEMGFLFLLFLIFFQSFHCSLSIYNEFFSSCKHFATSLIFHLIFFRKLADYFWAWTVENHLKTLLYQSLLRRSLWSMVSIFR